MMSLVCLSVCLLYTVVVYCLSAFLRIVIDYESCMWPISTNPASKEAGELAPSWSSRKIDFRPIGVFATIWKY